MKFNFTKRLSLNGFTLIELVVAIGVIAALLGIAVPMYAKYRLQAQIAQSESDLRALDLAIQIYQRENGSLPTNLSNLVGVPNKTDPWGKPYDYLKIDNNVFVVLLYAKKDFFEIPINKDYDLYSRGADGATIPVVFYGVGKDDIIRASSGGFFGLASNY